jgi:hypothetical protein
VQPDGLCVSDVSQMVSLRHALVASLILRRAVRCRQGHSEARDGCGDVRHDRGGILPLCVASSSRILPLYCIFCTCPSVVLHLLQHALPLYCIFTYSSVVLHLLQHTLPLYCIFTYPFVVLYLHISFRCIASSSTYPSVVLYLHISFRCIMASSHILPLCCIFTHPSVVCCIGFTSFRTYPSVVCCRLRKNPLSLSLPSLSPCPVSAGHPDDGESRRRRYVPTTRTA